MPRTIELKIENTQERDADFAIAMWRLAWADRVVLGEIDEDGKTAIQVQLSDGWESGPDEMVAWVKEKLSS